MLIETEVSSPIESPALLEDTTSPFDDDLDLVQRGTTPEHARATEAGPVILETTGVSSHPRQRAMFEKNLIYRLSAAAKLRECGYADLAGKLEECHSNQMFAQCGNCRKVRTFFNRCDRFYCPSCQPRLARERFESIEWWAKRIKQPKLLTLTVPNVDNIDREYVKGFKSRLAKLRRSKCARNWLSGTWALECTNYEFGWHVHAHMLIDARWLDKSAIEQTWSKLWGLPFSIIDTRDCRAKDYAKEATKYTCKGSEMASWTGHQIAEFVAAFSGGRHFGVFGELHGKRTEWREWIEAIGKERGLCSCGCNRWLVYDEHEWQWKEATEGIFSTGVPPPVQATPDLQLSLIP